MQLPEAASSATRARLRARAGGAAESEPPPEARRAIDGITALLRSGRADLASIAIDLPGCGDFERRAYAYARTIPAGRTATYGEIAAALGEPGAARAVGQAMARNPCPIVVPCHRVLAADGSLGGFSAAGGTTTKLRLLAIEGADVARQGRLFGP